MFLEEKFKLKKTNHEKIKQDFLGEIFDLYLFILSILITKVNFDKVARKSNRNVNFVVT